jgi:hypothetical protein
MNPEAYEVDGIVSELFKIYKDGGEMSPDVIKLIDTLKKSGTKITMIPPGGSMTLGTDVGEFSFLASEEESKEEFKPYKKGDSMAFDELIDSLGGSKKKEEVKPIKREDIMKEEKTTAGEARSIKTVTIEIEQKSDLVEGTTKLNVNTQNLLTAIWKENPEEVIRMLGTDNLLEKIGATKALEYFS